MTAPTLEELRNMSPDDIAAMAEQEVAGMVERALADTSGAGLLRFELDRRLLPWTSKSQLKRALDRLVEAGTIRGEPATHLGAATKRYRLVD